MYRNRTRGSKKFNEAMARARAAKEARRLEDPAPDYPPELPLIRRRVVVEDYDLPGQVVRHEFIKRTVKPGHFRAGRMSIWLDVIVATVTR